MSECPGPSYSLESVLVFEQQQLDRLLAVLRVVPGCSGAGESSYNGSDLNKMDVHVRVKAPDVSKSKYIRRSLTGELDTKLKAGLEVLRIVTDMVGEEAVRRAVQQVDGMDVDAAGPAEPARADPTGPTPDEQEWLAEWLDAHASPEDVTVADAEAALQQHRGAATLARLAVVQLLEAKVRAAQLRQQRAASAQQRAEQELVDWRSEHESKKPRQQEPAGDERPPFYERYSGYGAVTWLKEEGWAMRRRAIPIEEAGAEVEVANLPDGDDKRGWRAHWRHGMHGVYPPTHP